MSTHGVERTECIDSKKVKPSILHIVSLVISVVDRHRTLPHQVDDEVH
jgi:hypothetical protein